MSTLPNNEIILLSWLLAFLGAFVIGLSKAGIKGIAIVNDTLMALAFGAKESTGLIIPLLVLGDAFAVIYYNRHTQWKYIVQFLPWILIGVLIGVFIGKDLPETTFKWVMSGIILFSIIFMFWWDQRTTQKVPNHWGFASFIGILAGVTTMIGNLAGAFSNIFFLAMRLPKNQFIGTAAWLFLIVNLFKLPLHFFVWKTISVETLIINLKLIPAMIVGLLAGIFLVRLIKESFYRKMILVLTAIGAVLILFR